MCHLWQTTIGMIIIHFPLSSIMRRLSYIVLCIRNHPPRHTGDWTKQDLSSESALAHAVSLPRGYVRCPVPFESICNIILSERASSQGVESCSYSTSCTSPDASGVRSCISRHSPSVMFRAQIRDLEEPPDVCGGCPSVVLNRSRGVIT